MPVALWTATALAARVLAEEVGEMITQYAADVSHWEKWAQGYLYGVFLIFPPEPLLTRVNALRVRHDPGSQAVCDAHISLTVPLTRPVSEANWRALEGIAAAIEPFAIQYGPLLNLDPAVCLAIEPQVVLDKLRIALETAALFAGAPARKYPFLPHMTIAEFITAEQNTRLMQELENVAPRGVFTCTGVAYAVPDANFHFTERRRLQLGHR
jgi:2'-5' RNA ligase